MGFHFFGLICIKEKRERNYTDPITNVAEVVLIMGHELGGAFDIAIVKLVVEKPVHCHHHRLLHLV